MKPYQMLMWKVIGGIIIMLCSDNVAAQSFLEKVKNRALQTAENKAVNKSEEAVDKGIDKGINETGKSLKKNKAENKSAGKDNKPAANPETTEKQSTQNNQYSAFHKYDFVPGELIIYSNDFSNENIG